MRLYRCECGKSEYYGSGMTPAPCEGCDHCGSRFGTYQGRHLPREPHDWKPQFHPDTGKPTKPICTRCYKTGPMPVEENSPEPKKS